MLTKLIWYADDGVLDKLQCDAASLDRRFAANLEDAQRLDHPVSLLGKKGTDLFSEKINLSPFFQEATDDAIDRATTETIVHLNPRVKRGYVVTNPKAASKHLKSLNVSGFGRYIPLSNDPELGQGVYEIDLDGCALKIFEKGIAIKFKKKNVNVLYSNILEITSYLSAAVFSQASANQNVNISIPLGIYLSEEVVVFEVQLLIYSRVLIVLNDMWRSLKK